MIKRQLLKPSAFRVTRVAQASLHEKSQPVKGNEEFFVTTTFPDDYEGSRLKSDIDKKAATVDQGTTEQHKADIYDSLWNKSAGSPPKQRTAQDEALETEHEPEMDEM